MQNGEGEAGVLPQCHPTLTCSSPMCIGAWTAVADHLISAWSLAGEGGWGGRPKAFRRSRCLPTGQPLNRWNTDHVVGSVTKATPHIGQRPVAKTMRFARGE